MELICHGVYGIVNLLLTDIYFVFKMRERVPPSTLTLKSLIEKHVIVLVITKRSR